MAEELPQTSKKSSKNHVLRRVTSSSNDGPSEPVEIPPAIEAKTWWKCKNSACRAILHIEEIFCKRCSCCICQLFDDNKDPSLWFECTSELSEIDSCGLSCHIECALEHRKVMQLDGTYSCASCGKVLEILGYWKKQVVMAKDARRVDVLCYRISLSYRLLDGTSKHNEVHELIKAAKAKLESELGPSRRKFRQDVSGTCK
ncbi:VIN3-like protein 1 [Forsythia ovata]|uniref:VIN3-like protein 1 n=1 Tax=Forsythia ovata TaxID=205694 RepID=A0ABD1WM93_9LAMI